MASVSTMESSQVGRPVRDREGRRLGTLERVHGEGDRPSWGTVKPSRFGKRRLVRLGDSRTEGDEIRLTATKSQVKGAPRADKRAALSPAVQDRLRRHYSGPAIEPHERTTTAPAGRRRTMAVPRSRGAASGALLLLLGIWGALALLVGPYFEYGFGRDDAFNATTDMVWLSFLPGAAVIVGALILIAGRNRAGAALGAWLALAGGLWFATGPAVSLLWDAAGPAAPVGPPLGSEGEHVVELLGSFYGLGALITALAAFALGRLATVSVRDLEVAEERGRR